MNKFNLTPALIVAGALLSTVPVRANLIIKAIYDPSLNMAEQAVINDAIQQYQNLFTNNITVSIYFQAGGGLGQSNTISYFNNYQTFYQDLVAVNANPAAIAGLTANGGNAMTDPVVGNTKILVKSANGRAVGIAGDAPACTVTAVTAMDIPNNCGAGNPTGPQIVVDGIISLNTDLTWPPHDPADSYELLSVAEHEIDEVLGLGSNIDNCDPADADASAACKAKPVNWTTDTIAPEDLFRWSKASSATNTRSISSDCSAATGPTAFFAYGPQTGAIAQFNNTCNGGDFGDWQSSPLPGGTGTQVQDAFGSKGEGPSLGPSEIAALTAIGYTTAPEPATWAMLGGALAAAGYVRRRSVKRRQ